MSEWAGMTEAEIRAAIGDLASKLAEATEAEARPTTVHVPAMAIERAETLAEGDAVYGDRMGRMYADPGEGRFWIGTFRGTVAQCPTE